MLPRVTSDAHRLRVGDPVEYHGHQWRVEGMSALGLTLRHNEKDLPAVVSIRAVLDGRVKPLGPPDQSSLLPEHASLTPDELAEARLRQSWVNECEFGVPDPSDPTLTPRPGYEMHRTLGERRRLKVREVREAYERDQRARGTWDGKPYPISERTLQRWSENRTNLSALADHRKHRRTRACPDVPLIVVETAAKVLEEYQSQSSISRRNLVSRLKGRLLAPLEELSEPMPSDSTLGRVFDYLDPRDLARKTAKRRKQELTRPKRPWRPVKATFLGQYVEIDTTPLNFVTRDYEGNRFRERLTVIRDVFSKSILAYDFMPVGANAQDHIELIARLLRPITARPDTPAALRLGLSKELPADVLALLDPAYADSLAVPFIRPASITFDQGSDFNNNDVRAVLERFGITPRLAPPASGPFKGGIERQWGVIDERWAQHQPGYLGCNPIERGDIDISDIPLEDIPLQQDIRDSFEYWWIRIYQNTPHDSLTDRLDPTRRYSPNQWYAAHFDIQMGLPVPISEDDYVRMMPIKHLSITNDYFTLGPDTFHAPELWVLGQRRTGRKSNKWPVHVDRYDPTRLWVFHPETGELITCLSKKWHEVAGPYSAVREAMRSMPRADPALQDNYTIERLVEFDTKAAASRKARAQKRSAMARRQHDGTPRPDLDIPEDPMPTIPTMTSFNLI